MHYLLFTFPLPRLPLNFSMSSANRSARAVTKNPGFWKTRQCCSVVILITAAFTQPHQHKRISIQQTPAPLTVTAILPPPFLISIWVLFLVMATDGFKRSSIAPPPWSLNVEKFAESRASELEALHSIVENRLNNNFRSQRNKRRKTTGGEGVGWDLNQCARPWARCTHDWFWLPIFPGSDICFRN